MIYSSDTWMMLLIYPDDTWARLLVSRLALVYILAG
jgi:hypothetical protein